MENVNLRLIINRKGKGSEKVATSVEIRLTYHRKAKYISTGVKVTTSQWKDGRVVKHPDEFYLNQKITDMVQRVTKVVRTMEEEGFIDLQAIPDLIKKKGATITFWSYIEDRTEDKMGIEETTRQKYRVLLRKLKEYAMFKTFTEITEGNIRRFDERLKAEGIVQSTIYTYHKNLKVFIGDAVVDGFIKENPYVQKRIKIDRGEGRIDKYLTEGELAKIRKVTLVGTLAEVRDAFVFACYTGLSYSDLVEFGREDITDYNGIKMVNGKRAKNGQEYTFVLLEPALEILERYDYKLPVLSLQNYNERLKDVAFRAGVDKEITSHWARHTSAMTMLNNGVSIEIVAKVLGHASIRTTQKYYAKVQEEAVAREMQDYGKKMERKKRA